MRVCEIINEECQEYSTLAFLDKCQPFLSKTNKTLKLNVIVEMITELINTLLNISLLPAFYINKLIKILQRIDIIIPS